MGMRKRHLDVNLARAKATAEAIGAIELLREVPKAGQTEHVRAGREGEGGRLLQSCRLLRGQPTICTAQKLPSEMLHTCIANISFVKTWFTNYMLPAQTLLLCLQILF